MRALATAVETEFGWRLNENEQILSTYWYAQLLPQTTHPPPPPPKKKKSVRRGNERANSGCYAHVLAGTVLQDAVLLDSDVASLVNWLPTFQCNAVAFS
jgi:hypothetical protein